MIGIICAMQIEADGIIALMENKNTNTFYDFKFTSGTVHNKKVTVVVCGVGKVNAAMCTLLLIEKFSPEVVINSGVAGSLSELVSIGDIVVAKNSVEHDMNATALGDKQGEVTLAHKTVMYFDCDKKAYETMYKACKEIEDTRVELGTVASGDIFISDRHKRLKIRDNFNALACEMEGASVGHVCYCCKIPYTIIRAISDDLDENKGMDFVKFCSLAAKKTVFALNTFIEQW